MEKEVRAMLNKGEKVTLVAIDECKMNWGENALILGKEYDVQSINDNCTIFIDTEIEFSMPFRIKDIHQYFKLKQPKDPNELIGREAKGFRFEGSEYVDSMDKYIGEVGIIESYCSKENDYRVEFKDEYWYYPADQIEAHLLPEKKTKKQRIEELESLYKKLEEKFETFCSEFSKKVATSQQVNNLSATEGISDAFSYAIDSVQKQNLEDAKSMVNDKDELWNFFKNEHCLNLLDSEIEDIIHEVNKYQQQKQAPEFWYVDIVEEKDSELLPKFKEWFDRAAKVSWNFDNNFYGYCGSVIYDGYYTHDILDYFENSDKMQKITLQQWNQWFNK